MTPLAIRPALPGDIATVVRILNEANDWIVERGDPPWNSRPWRAEDAEGAIARGQTYLAMERGRGIARMSLQTTDETIWPGRPADALYVHRLAVERAAHGRHVGGDLLDFAGRAATDGRKRYVRLDCHCESPKLRDYYVRRGFSWIGDRTLGTPPRSYCASLLEKAL